MKDRARRTNTVIILEKHLDQLANIVMIKFLHDANFADQVLVSRLLLPDALAGIDHLHCVPFPSSFVDCFTDGCKRSLSEFDAEIVLCEKTFCGLPSCRVTIDKACAEGIRPPWRVWKLRGRRTVVFKTIVLHLRNACPKCDLISFTKDPGMAFADPFTVNLWAWDLRKKSRDECECVDVQRSHYWTCLRRGWTNRCCLCHPTIWRSGDCLVKVKKKRGYKSKM